MSSIGLYLNYPNGKLEDVRTQASAHSHDLSTLLRFAIGILEPLLDALAVGLALKLSWMISTVAHLPAGPSYKSPGATLVAFMATCILLLLERAGSYQPAKSLLFIRETAILLAASARAALILVALAGLHVIALPMLEIPVNTCLLFLCLLIEKTLVHAAEQRLHRSGISPTPVAICGTGLACRRLYSTLVNSPKIGLWPTVIIDPVSSDPATSIVECAYRVRQSAEVIHQEIDCAALRSAGVKKVMLIASCFNERQLQEILHRADRCGMPTEICAGDVASSDGPMECTEMDGLVMWRPQHSTFQSIYDLTKRALDLALSSLLAVTLCPVMVIVVIAIKLTSPGEVLFRQKRVGKGGKLFTILKFRTMHASLCVDGFSPTSEDDSRVTRTGRFLRKTSLDELPQLLNVLKGEMSLVGPRPEMPFLVQEYTPLQSRRLEVLPGITGLWQLSAHRRDLIHNNMQYDLYYVRHRGYFLDCAILMHTLLFAVNGI